MTQNEEKRRDADMVAFGYSHDGDGQRTHVKFRK